jgi:hypothetical protein
MKAGQTPTALLIGTLRLQAERHREGEIIRGGMQGKLQFIALDALILPYRWGRQALRKKPCRVVHYFPSSYYIFLNHNIQYNNMNIIQCIYYK